VIITAVSIKGTAFSVAPFNLVDNYHLWEGIYWPRLCRGGLSILKTKVELSFETLINLHTKLHSFTSQET